MRAAARLGMLPGMVRAHEAGDRWVAHIGIQGNAQGAAESRFAFGQTPTTVELSAIATFSGGQHAKQRGQAKQQTRDHAALK